MCKQRSGGNLQGSFLGSHSVDVLHLVMNLLEQLRGVLHPLEPLRRVGPQPEGGEGRLDRVARPQVASVGLRELGEGEHPVPVPVYSSRGAVYSSGDHFPPFLSGQVRTAHSGSSFPRRFQVEQTSCRCSGKVFSQPELGWLCVTTSRYNSRTRFATLPQEKLFARCSALSFKTSRLISPTDNLNMLLTMSSS